MWPVVSKIAELAIWWISSLALSLSSVEAHCWSSPLSSTLISVSCPRPLAVMTDTGELKAPRTLQSSSFSTIDIGSKRVLSGSLAMRLNFSLAKYSVKQVRL